MSHKMLQYPTPRASKLDAINYILATIGETPVSTLEGQLPADVALANQLLEHVTREIQLNGYNFNTEYNFPLVPDKDTQEIMLPNNVIEVFLDEPNQNMWAVRNNRLYDLVNHTYKFTTTIKANVTIILPFADMPEAFRNYCIIRTARKFQDKTLGAGDLHSFDEGDEMRARAIALNADTRMGRPGMKSNYQSNFLEGWSVARQILMRN